MVDFVLHQYFGDNPQLVSGDWYNLKQLAEVSGVNYNTLHTRLKRHSYVELDDAFLALVYVRPPITMLPDKSTRMMDEWLRKAPMSIDQNYNPHNRAIHEL